MPQPAFKLNTSTMAILYESNQRTIVTIPANALVTLVDGDAEGNGFVKVQYRDKILSMFAYDLRSRGERRWGTIGVGVVRCMLVLPRVHEKSPGRGEGISLY
jgi:hypothetical protein